MNLKSTLALHYNVFVKSLGITTVYFPSVVCDRQKKFEFYHSCIYLSTGSYIKPNIDLSWMIPLLRIVGYMFYLAFNVSLKSFKQVLIEIGQTKFLIPSSCNATSGNGMIKIECFVDEYQDI